MSDSCWTGQEEGTGKRSQSHLVDARILLMCLGYFHSMSFTSGVHEIPSENSQDLYFMIRSDRSMHVKIAFIGHILSICYVDFTEYYYQWTFFCSLIRLSTYGWKMHQMVIMPKSLHPETWVKRILVSWHTDLSKVFKTHFASNCYQSSPTSKWPSQQPAEPCCYLLPITSYIT